MTKNSKRIIVHSWGKLIKLIENDEEEGKARLYRGVENIDFALIPTIGRHGARKDKNSGDELPYREDHEKKLLEFLSELPGPT